jgi:hypothetical protein
MHLEASVQILVRARGSNKFVEHRAWEAEVNLARIALFYVHVLTKATGATEGFTVETQWAEHAIKAAYEVERPFFRED